MSNVGHPFAIAQEIGLARGHPRKQDGELGRLAVQADQIEAALLTDHEQLFAIRTWGWITEHQRAYCQLRGFRARLAKQGGTLAQGPDVLRMIASRLK